MGMKTLNKLLEEIPLTLPGKPPHVKNHLHTENHWESRYGELWRTHLDASYLMSGYASIHHLVAHLVAEDNHIFANTKHVNSWQFYHNVLSQLTSKPTINRMKENGYYKCWTTPVLDICDEFKNHSNQVICRRRSQWTTH